ncbi:hypothetical protein LMC05_06335 [Limosilactobacillus reuteri]|uniref:hypothetical protein n=1 Tax=Limosilactobacillus reuteri TaxID=1598 RepID=UPI001E2B6AA7|nr:hypothetical protein [Limosilactobacillus reuteri]MCC4508613.1 hypothetical protein [Limosilactobacillus reuteri]
MMNLKMNTQNNQGQAMDYFVGGWEEDMLLRVLNNANIVGVNYLKVGDNYLFESNYNGHVLYKVRDDDKIIATDKDYKAIVAIKEETYYEGETHHDYGFFFTNDDKKIEKFKAYVQANELSNENDLELNTQKLEGKIFPSWRERRDMALNGMYLG